MYVNACARVQGFTGTLISVKRNESCLTFHFLLLDTLFERYEWQKVLCVAFCTRPRAIWKWCVSPQWYTWHSSCEPLSWMTSFFFSPHSLLIHIYMCLPRPGCHRENKCQRMRSFYVQWLFFYMPVQPQTGKVGSVWGRLYISTGAAIYSLVTGHIGWQQVCVHAVVAVLKNQMKPFNCRTGEMLYLSWGEMTPL